MNNLRILNYFFIISAISFFLTGCNRDEIINTPVNPVHITTGAYILNEGQFSANTSSLTFYSFIKDSIYNNIFKPGNLGLFPDGLIQYNENIFITEQGNFGSAGKIYKCDSSGTVITSNTLGKNSYSLCVSNNKIYVTNGTASNVSVVDINSLSTTKTIGVGVFPQEIVAFGSYVYVCNTSLYGSASDSTISVIDNTTDAVIKTIAVHKDPSSIVKSKNNQILVGCPGQNGCIFIIDPISNKKIDSITNIDFGKDISIDLNSDNIYFISNSNKIMLLDLNLRTLTTFIDNPNPSAVYFNGYAFDYKNNVHYVVNARDFVSQGLLYIADAYGNLLESFPVGFVPRRVIIKSN